jgi:hypothetical protein
MNDICLMQRFGVGVADTLELLTLGIWAQHEQNDLIAAMRYDLPEPLPVLKLA